MCKLWSIPVTHVRNRNQHKDRLMHLAIVELYVVLLLKLLEVLRVYSLLQDSLHIHVLTPLYHNSHCLADFTTSGVTLICNGKLRLAMTNDRTPTRQTEDKQLRR